MKSKILIFILFLCLGQNKKQTIFLLYNGEIPKIEKKNTIKIDNHYFQIIENNCKNGTIKSYSKKIISFNDFIKKYKINNFNDLVKYDLYIYKPTDKNKGIIYKVEYSLVINKPIE